MTYNLHKNTQIFIIYLILGFAPEGGSYCGIFTDEYTSLGWTGEIFNGICIHFISSYSSYS